MKRKKTVAVTMLERDAAHNVTARNREQKRSELKKFELVTVTRFGHQKTIEKGKKMDDESGLIDWIVAVGRRKDGGQVAGEKKGVPVNYKGHRPR